MAHPIDEGFFSARDGLRLYWQTVRPDDPAAAPAHVALVHGFAEHVGRHTEVTSALCDAGYVVHLLDVRGHGQSGGTRAHVDRYQDYLADLDLFLARVREAAKEKPVFLLSHSHGGLICSRYLLEKPEAVRGAVFSAPFFRLKMPVPPLKIWAGRLVGRLFPTLPMKNDLDPAMLTRDAAIQRATRTDPLYLHTVTPRFFTECSAAQEEVLRRASEFVTPMLVLVGSADPVVDGAAAREFFEAATAKDKTFKSYEGLLHEIFHEPERDLVFKDVVGWLDARSRAVPAAATSAAAR